jgi:hypothetical protein
VVLTDAAHADLLGGLDLGDVRVIRVDRPEWHSAVVEEGALAPVSKPQAEPTACSPSARETVPLGPVECDRGEIDPEVLGELADQSILQIRNGAGPPAHRASHVRSSHPIPVTVRTIVHVHDFHVVRGWTGVTTMHQHGCDVCCRPPSRLGDSRHEVGLSNVIQHVEHRMAGADLLHVAC